MAVLERPTHAPADGGTPAVAPPLAERAARRALRDQAARAAPRIQLTIALLLVPAVLLIVAAGLVHGLT